MKYLLALPAAGLLALAACSSMSDSASTNMNAAPQSVTTPDTTVANGNPLPGAQQNDGVENPGDRVGGVDTPPASGSDSEPQ